MMAICTSKGSVSVERVNTSGKLVYQGLGQDICAMCAGYDCILPMMGKKRENRQWNSAGKYPRIWLTLSKVTKVKEQDK